MHTLHQFVRYKYLITIIIIFLLSFFIWNTLILSTISSSLNVDMNAVTTLDEITDNKGYAIKTNKPLLFSSNTLGYYETTEETIVRLKRDVVVTGTILSKPEHTYALFQIEGMSDAAFNINTQLMDGFIIKKITESYVVLKNQTGNETFSLYVQSGGGVDLDD